MDKQKWVIHGVGNKTLEIETLDYKTFQVNENNFGETLGAVINGFTKHDVDFYTATMLAYMLDTDEAYRFMVDVCREKGAHPAWLEVTAEYLRGFHIWNNEVELFSKSGEKAFPKIF